MNEVIITEENGGVKTSMAINFYKLYQQEYETNFIMTSVGNHEGMWEFEFEVLTENDIDLQHFIESFSIFNYADTHYNVNINSPIGMSLSFSYNNDEIERLNSAS